MNNLSTSELSSLAIIFGILIITYFVLRSVFFPVLKKIAKKTSTFIDDLFLDKKFLNRLSYVLVIIVFTFLEDSSLQLHYIWNLQPVIAGVTYTKSCYVKAAKSC